jgi:NADH-quinone oxidoreductase subunit L
LIELVWLVPSIPLAVAAVNLFCGRRLGRISGWLATGAVALAFVVAVGVVADLASLAAEERTVVRHLADWVRVGSFEAAFDLRVDPLSAVMILVVTGVGALIHLYSIGYMENDPRRGRFFAFLNLFVALMLVLVLADNFLFLFLGWEGVGLCSYLLIGFYQEKLSAGNAAKKAFVTTRIGDTLMLIGIALIFVHFGSLNFGDVLDPLQGGPDPDVDAGAVTIISLLLFAGAVGKSAQVPLHVWLPDAMEGPSPVSALIHAATMVTAGVYLVTRAHGLFEASGVGQGEDVQAVVIVVGIVTLLYAGLAAIGQDDIKRVLAYSTISQIGFMFFAAGMGAYAIAMLMLLAHAFYKALMFLAAGSVMHGLDGELDLKRMGGLRQAMPATAAAFGIGAIALAGIPPLSGFFAKDPILAEAATSGRALAWILGLIGALISAVYISRAWFLAFYGDRRSAAHPHESPPIMTVPLAVLSVGAAGAGILGLSSETGLMARWLEPVVGELEPGSAGPPEGVLIALSVAMAVIGIGISWYLWSGRIDWLELRRKLGGLHPALESGFGIDRLFGAIVQTPLKTGSRLLAAVVDRRWIDGVVDAIGGGVRGGAGIARRVQTGLVRRYALAMLLGAAVVLLYVGVRL